MIAVLSGFLALAVQGLPQRDAGGGSEALVGEPGRVLLQRKVSNDSPGFPDTLEALDRFGQGVTVLGDLDGDGVAELAAGAPGDDDGGTDGRGRGALWIFFRNVDGSFRSKQKISALQGGFSASLALGDAFGWSLCGPGDVDGDAIPDLVVGAPGSSVSGATGSIWVLFLKRDGTVRGQRRIGPEEVGLVSPANSRFGASLASAGDWNVDGVPDVVVGVPTKGVAFLIFLGRSGAALGSARIGTPAVTRYGEALAFVGDLDGDGLSELATVGLGSVYVLFLRAAGTVRRSVLSIVGPPQPIVSLAGPGDPDGDGKLELWLMRDQLHSLERHDLDARGTASNPRAVPLGSLQPVPLGQFGASQAFIGLDSGGRAQVALGAPNEDDSQAFGALYTFSVTELSGVGRALDARKLGDRDGLMAGTLDSGDRFGDCVASLGDVDGDGVGDLAVGAPFDEDLRGQRRVFGAVWIVFLQPGGGVKAVRKISAGQGGFTGVLADSDGFGESLAPLGDLDGDGVVDLAVGAPDDDGLDNGSRTNQGSVWVLLLQRDGTVKHHVRLGSGAGGFQGTLPPQARFGTSLAPAGDRDGNGTTDLFVGGRGTVHVLLLRRDGSVRGQHALATTFLGSEDVDFGVALAALGDLDGDGAGDLAVGESAWLGGRRDVGAVWVLRLDPAGAVLAAHRIDDQGGGLSAPLAAGDRFGAALAAPGDLDGDGVRDLVVGTPFHDQDVTPDGLDRGRVHVLLLNRDGSVRRELHIDGLEGGFTGELDPRDSFGAALAVLGDRTREGVPELAVGVPFDDAGRSDHGALWLLALGGSATLDFEHGLDGLVTFDGQALPGGSELGAFVRVTGTGSNLGPALFDSSPAGPNRFSSDPDLLVGRGNVLILQDSLAGAQTYPGLYDRPDDDADGGVLHFDLARPAHPRSIALIDVDTRAVRVRLIDDQGRERLYDVPPGWTGDRTTGAPGIGTLDLTTLSPQPGHAATATAFESPTFDAEHVVRLTLELSGSGAVDDLILEPR